MTPYTEIFAVMAVPGLDPGIVPAIHAVQKPRQKP